MSEQRYTASSITDRALDELYAERDALLAALGATAADAARHRWCSMRENQLVQRAEQAEELLGVAEQTSSQSEAERASAVQRAEIAENDLRVLRSGLRAAGADPTQIQNLWAQLRMRNKQWRAEKQRAEQAERDHHDAEVKAGVLRRRVDVLAHVAAGNKRHVQLVVPELEKAEATIERVQQVLSDLPDQYAVARIRAALADPKE
jgi:hypothetical protein